MKEVLSSRTPAVAGHVRWSYVVSTLFALQAVGMIDKINVGIVMAFKPFLNAMGLVGKPAMAGLIMTLFLVAYGVGMPIWGYLCDRIGPRLAAIYAVVIWILMLLLGGLATNVEVLYISRIGLGLAEAVIWPVSHKLTARWFPVAERSRASGVWIAGINFGIVLAGLIVPTVILSSGWRSAFFVLAAVGLIPLVMMMRMVSDTPRQSKQVGESEVAYIEGGMLERTERVPDHERNAQAVVFKNYRFWLLTIANVATGMGIFGINTWLPTYLTKVRHMTLTGEGLFTAVAWFLCIGVLILVGLWSDKILRRAPFGVVSFLIYAVCLMGATAAKSPVVALLLIGLAIFALQTTTVAVMSLLHSIGGAGTMGAGSGGMVGISNFIGAFAPLIMGMILGATGNWTASFGFLAGMAVLSAVLMGIMVPQRY